VFWVLVGLCLVNVKRTADFDRLAADGCTIRGSLRLAWLTLIG